MKIKKLLLLFSVFFLSTFVFAQSPKSIQNNTIQNTIQVTAAVTESKNKNKMSPELAKKDRAALEDNKKGSDGSSILDKMRRGWNSFIDVLVGKPK